MMRLFFTKEIECSIVTVSYGLAFVHWQLPGLLCYQAALHSLPYH